MTAYPSWVIFPRNPLCVNAGRRNHPDRPAVVGTELCGPCHRQFGEVVKHIRDVWRDLTDSVMRAPARVYDQPTSRSGDTPDVSSYWNPAATLVIQDISEWAAFLHRTIISERRDLDWSDWRYVDREDTLVTLSLIAKWHHRWLSHHPSLGAGLLADAQRFSWAIEKALNTVPMQRVTLTGHLCREVIAETSYGVIVCEGQLVGVLRATDDRNPSTIVCSNHPDHRIPMEEWAHLDLA